MEENDTVCQWPGYWYPKSENEWLCVIQNPLQQNYLFNVFLIKECYFQLPLNCHKHIKMLRKMRGDNIITVACFLLFAPFSLLNP